MCDKAADTHPSKIKFVPECYETQKKRHRAVHRCFFVFDFIPGQYKTQEIYNLAVSLHPSFIMYCPCKYVAQEVCDEAVDNSVAALKLIPICFGLLQVK